MKSGWLSYIFGLYKELQTITSYLDLYSLYMIKLSPFAVPSMITFNMSNVKGL